MQTDTAVVTAEFPSPANSLNCGKICDSCDNSTQDELQNCRAAYVSDIKLANYPTPLSAIESLQTCDYIAKTGNPDNNSFSTMSFAAAVKSSTLLGVNWTSQNHRKYFAA